MRLPSNLTSSVEAGRVRAAWNKGKCRLYGVGAQRADGSRTSLDPASAELREPAGTVHDIPESPTAVNHRYLAPRAGCSPTRGGAGAGYCNVVLISINSGGGSRANDTYCSKNTPNCPSCSKLQYPRNLVLQIARCLIAVQHHLRKLARSLERGYAL